MSLTPPLRFICVMITLFMTLALSLSCKERRIKPESSEGSDANAMASGNEAVSFETSKDPEVEEELRRLAQEKVSSEKRVEDLQKMIEDLEGKMNAGGTLSEGDKVAYQKQLELIMKEKQAAEAQKKAVEEEMRKAAAARKRFYIAYDKPEPTPDDCLAFEGQDPSLDGAQLRVLPCNKSPQQVFMIDNITDSTFRFVSSLSSKCISVLNDSKEADAQLVQKPCGTMPGQVFKMIEKTANEFYFQSTNSGFCLKIIGDGHVHQNNCQTTASPFHINLVESP